MVVRYPNDQEPNLWFPIVPTTAYRFVLGRIPTDSTPRPLVVLGMNPSHADHEISDATINRIIEVSQQREHAGWLMLNVYPGRASSPTDLGTLDADLVVANCAIIVTTLRAMGVTEILGAWGDLTPDLEVVLVLLLMVLTAEGIKIYYLDDLTVKGHPRHPNPRGSRPTFDGVKRYFGTEA